MSYEYTFEELRSICRRSIETVEIWARRLIDEKMTEKYGHDYIDTKIDEENYLINKEIRIHVHTLMDKYPSKYGRFVDALQFDHIIYFLCKTPLYQDLFKDALDYAYPLGKEEVKSFLNRLIPIRNSLSHANCISTRQIEQAICYSNDFVDGLKQYYKDKGMEQDWNVPRIIRITDSLGNDFSNPYDRHTQRSIFKIKQALYCGDTYAVTVEIDPSFSQEEYDIQWRDDGKLIKENNNKVQYITAFTEKDVAQLHMIVCRLKSHKAWHKYGSYDCEIDLHLTIFPRE